MQQTGVKSKGAVIKMQLVKGAGSILWVLGMLLAGSDGEAYINGIGVMLFAGASLWLGFNHTGERSPSPKPVKNQRVAKEIAQDTCPVQNCRTIEHGYVMP